MVTGDHTWKYKRSLFISYFKLLIAKSNHHHEKKHRTSTSMWCTDNSQHKQHTLGSSQGTWEWMPLTRSYLSQISHVSAPVPYETSCCVKSTYVNMPRSTFPVLNKRLPFQFYLVSIPESSKIKSWHVAFPHSHDFSHTLHDFSHLWPSILELLLNEIDSTTCQGLISPTWSFCSQCENPQSTGFSANPLTQIISDLGWFFLTKSLV